MPKRFLIAELEITTRHCFLGAVEFQHDHTPWAATAFHWELTLDAPDPH
jgi:hypothetical protein